MSIYSAKNSFKITLTQATLLKQINSCFLCDKMLFSMKERHIDHDHVTGVIRGVLCHKCNINLGGYEKIISKNIPNLLEYLAGKDRRIEEILRK